MEKSNNSEAVITHLFDGLEQSIVDIVTDCTEAGVSVRSAGGILYLYINSDTTIKVGLNQSVQINKKTGKVKIV